MFYSQLGRLLFPLRLIQSLQIKIQSAPCSPWRRVLLKHLGGRQTFDHARWTVRTALGLTIRRPRFLSFSLSSQHCLQFELLDEDRSFARRLLRRVLSLTQINRNDLGSDLRCRSFLKLLLGFSSVPELLIQLVQLEKVCLVDDDRDSLLLVHCFELFRDLAPLVRYLFLTLVFLIFLTFYYNKSDEWIR